MTFGLVEAAIVVTFVAGLVVAHVAAIYGFKRTRNAGFLLIAATFFVMPALIAVWVGVVADRLVPAPPFGTYILANWVLLVSGIVLLVRQAYSRG